MDQENITREIISGIVDLYIREISQDPNRAVRKLLDMAERTSDGPTQKICYQMMQQMAKDERSPYYEMIHHLVTTADPLTIRQFGINLGRNAWTFGSGHIRRLIKEQSTSIPWAVIIDRRNDPERIPFEDVKEIIRCGHDVDVFAYVLLVPDDPDEWAQYAELFRAYGDCDFAVCAGAPAFKEEVLEQAAGMTNLMFLVNTDEPGWQDCFEKLEARGFLYSAFRFVSDAEQAEDVISGSWFDGLVPYHPLMAFTSAADELPEECARSLKVYMWNTRLEQVYPFLPVDMISDFVIINRLVTQKDTLYRIEADGRVSVAEEFRFRRQ